MGRDGLPNMKIGTGTYKVSCTNDHSYIVVL